MNKLLTVNNVTVKAPNGAELVKNISFDIQRNETVALLGQSGCGKTITSMAILDLLPPGVHMTSGTVMTDGKPVTKEARGSLIGMIMQAPASCFDQVFTIRTQFTDILKSNGKISLCCDSYFCKLINDVELTNPMDILDAYPFQLSGGMLQRLMIAITLALDTPIIIADEPTSDLDLPAQKEILDMLLKFDMTDRGMLMITHDMSVAMKMADRIIVMKDGAIVDSFSIGDINADNRHSYTKSLLSANANLYCNPWGLHIGASHA